jgi:hypothetical protein
MYIVYMYVWTNVYNINGGVANIFYQSCAQIDNNQQVYEAQIQVPRCNSILEAGSHECQIIVMSYYFFNTNVKPE